MSIQAIIMLGFGLAMDAFAVSISSGITIRKLRIHHAMLIATFFGFFQAVMPLLGWGCGIATRNWLADYDHWVAFILLTGIGTKMIYDACNQDDDTPTNPLDIYILFTLSIATSIDAFAAGITLSLLHEPIVMPVLIIGLITFAMSFIGSYIGKLFGHLFDNKLEILGGAVLIGLGIKILIQQLFLT